MSVVLESPPYIPIEPVTENFHGIEAPDPYRWLEDQDSERTRRWIKEQTDYARSYLDAIPGRERVQKRIAELLAVETIDAPFKVGNRYFFLKREARQDQSVICMKEGAGGRDQVLVDPATRGTGARMSVWIVRVSPDKVRVRGANRIAVDPFGFDLLAAPSFDRVVDPNHQFAAERKNRLVAQRYKIGGVCPHQQSHNFHNIKKPNKSLSGV
jgi:hypothetical protein